MGFQSFSRGLYTPPLFTPLSVSHGFLESCPSPPFRATPAQQAAFLSCNHALDFITLGWFEVSMRAFCVFVCYSTSRSSTCPQDYLFLLHCSFRTQFSAIGSRQTGSHCGWITNERMGQGCCVNTGHKERWATVLHFPGESRVFTVRERTVIEHKPRIPLPHFTWSCCLFGVRRQPCWVAHTSLKLMILTFLPYKY